MIEYDTKSSFQSRQVGNSDNDNLLENFIKDEDIYALRAIFQKNPQWIREPLMGVMPLELAVILNKPSSIYFLLNHGAFDERVNYSNYTTDEVIRLKLNACNAINDRVNEALDKMVLHVHRAVLLKPSPKKEKLLEILRDAILLAMDSTLVCRVDTCVTVSSLLNIAINIDGKNFIKQLKNYFLKRELYIKETSLDYTCRDHRANQLCANVARQFFNTGSKDASPYDVLLCAAKERENTWEKWLDPVMQTESLPDQWHQFFRTKDDKIHLYESVVEQAIAALKNGAVSLESIWFGTDAKGAPPARQEDSKACLPGKPLPLTQDDFVFLKQRSPALAELVEYTQRLDSYNKEKADYFTPFANLVTGLRAGDYKHEGSELNAGGRANVAIVEFNEFWCRVDKKVKEEIRKLSNGSDTIGEVLDIILDAGNSHRRHAIRYCIAIKADMLEGILSKESVQKKMRSFLGSFHYMSQQDVDSVYKKIIRELSFRPVKKLQQYEFVNVCSLYKLDWGNPQAIRLDDLINSGYLEKQSVFDWSNDSKQEHLQQSNDLQQRNQENIMRTRVNYRSPLVSLIKLDNICGGARWGANLICKIAFTLFLSSAILFVSLFLSIVTLLGLLRYFLKPLFLLIYVGVVLLDLGLPGIIAGLTLLSIAAVPLVFLVGFSIRSGFMSAVDYLAGMLDLSSESGISESNQSARLEIYVLVMFAPIKLIAVLLGGLAAGLCVTAAEIMLAPCRLFHNCFLRGGDAPVARGQVLTLPA